MPREPEGYRDQLESLIRAFPDRECLRICDVASYCGITPKTAAKRYPFIGHGPGRYITRSRLARLLVAG